MEEDKLVDKMLALGRMVSYYKSNFYGCNYFKINASSSGLLSQRQYEILVALKYIDVKNLSKLAKLLHTSNSNLSILVSKLTEQGYVTRKYPGYNEDKRKIYFYITPKGDEIVEQITNKIVDNIVLFYTGLDENQKILLKDGLNILICIKPQDNNVFFQGRFFLSDKYKIDPLDDSITIAHKLFNILLIFFNWSAANFMNLFKVNGNDANSLSDRQFEILFYVSNLNCNTISKLENVIYADSSTLSNSISKLVRDGFITKVYPDNNTDGRLVYFVITKKGELTLNQIESNIKAILKNFLKTLTDEQQAKLALGLDKIYKFLISNQELKTSNADNDLNLS